jgi:hypothetical protein
VTKTAGDAQLENLLRTASGCATATVETVDAKSSGSLTFNADSTYSANLTQSAKGAAMVPTSCLNRQGFTLTCGLLNQALAALTLPGVSSIKCGDVSGGCSCSFVASPDAINETGTYSLSGTTVSFSGSVPRADYCVAGGSLHLISLDTSTPPAIIADLVASKQ